MEALRLIFLTIEILLLAYIGFSAIYFLCFSIFSFGYTEKKISDSFRRYKVAVLIPSYKEDSVIIETALSAMHHKSKSARISALVIADSLQPSTLRTLHCLGIPTLEVAFENSTKSQSLQKAVEVIDRETDYVVILDADNIMTDGFVDKIIYQAEQGYKIVQGHRTAKNANTAFAFLDGISSVCIPASIFCQWRVSIVPFRENRLFR